MTAVTATAQDFDRIAPNQPNAEKAGTVLQADKPSAPAPAENRPLLSNLKGLLFVADVKKSFAAA